MTMKLALALSICFGSFAYTGTAQDTKPAASDAAELAKKLANPVASLISVPLQNNMDVGIGEFNGSRNTLNIQPVFPFPLTPKINLIARVILPVISQHDIVGEGTRQSGLSDVLASAFFAPSDSENGLIWGAGPVFLIPTATNELLGGKKFGVGPTALALRQANGWTYGALVNQVWSIAGDKTRPNVNQMFLQPFITYNWKSGAGIVFNAEITQNWEGNNTTAFINPAITGVTKLGKQTVSLVAGPRIQVAAPGNNKADFGVRTALTFVFPK